MLSPTPNESTLPYPLPNISGAAALAIKLRADSAATQKCERGVDLCCYADPICTAILEYNTVTKFPFKDCNSLKSYCIDLCRILSKNGIGDALFHDGFCMIYSQAPWFASCAQ